MKSDILVLAGIGAGIAALYLAGSAGSSGSGGGAPVFGELAGTPEPLPVTVYQFPPQPEVNFPQPQLWTPQTILTPQVAQNRKKEAMKEVAKAVMPVPVKALTSLAEPIGYQKGLGKNPKISTKKAEKMNLIKFDQPSSPKKSATELVARHISRTKLSTVKKGTTGGGRIKTGTVSTKKAEKIGLIKFDQPVKKKKKHTSGHHYSSSSYAYHYKHNVPKPSSNRVWVAM